MDHSDTKWRVSCDREVFERCRGDKRFGCVVALARATNALNSAHSLLVCAGDKDTPKASRDRLNSYFFASAILYEVIKLLRRMNGVFRDDEAFRQTMAPVLKNPVAIKIEKDHLKQVRHEAVFHFDPESFAETVDKSSVDECVFATALGVTQGDVNYAFADVIAAEILAGMAEHSEKFYEVLQDAMAKTRDLLNEIVPAAEWFISHHLHSWGFTLKEE
jgi:hypothetical protein